MGLPAFPDSLAGLPDKPSEALLTWASFDLAEAACLPRGAAPCRRPQPKFTKVAPPAEAPSQRAPPRASQSADLLPCQALLKPRFASRSSPAPLRSSTGLPPADGSLGTCASGPSFTPKLPQQPPADAAPIPRYPQRSSIGPLADYSLGEHRGPSAPGLGPLPTLPQLWQPDEALACCIKGVLVSLGYADAMVGGH